MVVSLFIGVVVVFFGAYGIIKVARKYWRKSEVQEQKDKAAEAHTLRQVAQEVDTKQALKDNKAVKDFLDLDLN